MTAPDLAMARKALSEQPFSMLLGTRVVAFGDGAATLELDLRDELRQQHGHVHGGVLSYVAENTLAFAAGSVLGPALLTSGFTIEYVRPARGVTLRVRAEVVQASRSRATCRGELYTVDDAGTETLCALTQGTIRVPRTA